MEDSSISFDESGLVAYNGENEYAATVINADIDGDEDDPLLFYSGVKTADGEGIPLQAPFNDFYRVKYTGQMDYDVNVTAESTTDYARYSSVYAVLSFAKFSGDNTFTLEHIAFEATVDGSSITFTLLAENIKSIFHYFKNKYFFAFKYSVIYTVSVDYRRQTRNAEQTVNFEVF